VYFLPDVLKRFQQAFPRLNISIRPGHSKEVLEMVLNEEAEIGLARSLQHPEVETISLRDDPLILVAHPTLKLGMSRRARLEQVAGWPLIFYERGSSDWTLTRSLFRHAGLVPNVALEVDTIETAKRMVERGLGVSFLPLMAVGPEMRKAELTPIKLIDAEPLHRSLDLIHPRHRPLRAQAQSFLRVVREVVKERSSTSKNGHAVPKK
jgi:DNA-binding transcriptional LysR family regulator